MTGSGPAAVVVLAVLLLAVTGASRLRARATTADFYLAGRSVGVITNAFAICGDYFSAASFLGVAAAVYASVLDGVCYATGFAAGFVPVLLFVAAPLRRFGDFSIPDFLGHRFDDERVRVAAVIVVELVILAYLLPQMVGSGITWELLVGRGVLGLSPYATGVVASALFTAGLVVLGGMRGTTWNQALQFWFLLATLAWLTALAVTHGFSYQDGVDRASQEPLQVVVEHGGTESLETVQSRLDDGPARFAEPGARYGPVGAFALLVTLVLGTAGLPHVMNRYFTSPSGRAARATTVWVLGLAGVFYSLAVLLGTAARTEVAAAAPGRPWLEELTVGGVLRVPEHALLVLGRLWGGTLGAGVVAAAALVAIISTVGGLLLAAAASWGHDLYERHLNRRATQAQAVRAGRIAVLVATVVTVTAALLLQPERLAGTVPSIVAAMVTWAFALAGSSLTPVLLLAIWWRRTTATGALAGMVVGVAVAVGAVGVGLLLGDPDAGLTSLLLAPTLLGAPASTIACIAVSRRQPEPPGTEGAWVRLHGTAGDRRIERLARMTRTSTGR